MDRLGQPEQPAVFGQKRSSPRKLGSGRLARSAADADIYPNGTDK
jgi:hypothetical protein